MAMARTEPVTCARLAGSRSHWPRRSAGLRISSFWSSTSGCRKLSRTNSARLSAMRCLPCGMSAVCGIGSPSGWRNSATTANQSARPPMAAASQKALSQAQGPWAPITRLTASPASEASRQPSATSFMRRRSAARGSGGAEESIKGIGDGAAGLMPGAACRRSDERDLVSPAQGKRCFGHAPGARQTQRNPTGTGPSIQHPLRRDSTYCGMATSPSYCHD